MRVLPGEAGYEDAACQEAFRRLRRLVQSHPTLSGLMESEFKGYLRRVLHRSPGTTVEPAGEPDFAAEIGYDALELES